MLSESEQRRLNEIESLLNGEDPSWARRFARTADAITVHRRRVAAVVVAILATVIDSDHQVHRDPDASAA